MAERVDPTAAAPGLLRETSPDRWDKTLAAFLAEKLRRSGSHRTVETYAGILRSCFGRLGTTPDAFTPAGREMVINEDVVPLAAIGRGGDLDNGQMD